MPDLSASRAPARRTRRAIQRLRQAGPRASAKQVRRRIWSTEGWLDLRADLLALPALLPARVPLVMEPCDDRAFQGFEEEAERVSGSDLEEVMQRQRWSEAGVRRLYVAWSDGQPAYCQWLTLPADLPLMATANPSGTYEPLASDEVLLEGAYTFVRSRGCGAMADCMGQLLRIAHDGGARAALTCVADDNVPSLKGCARAGFLPDSLRVSRWRLGRHEVRTRPGREAATWRAIT